MADGSVTALTHVAVVVESSALVQRRLGMAALRSLHTDLLPVLDVVWVTEELHGRALAALLAADRRDVSLVDRTSFELMRQRGLDQALAYDDDFAAQGFVAW